jgi:RNA polymerase sigma-70 factor (ECF subfamily)
MGVESAVDHEYLARLLSQAGRGDEKAFAELYRLTSGKLFGVCLRMLRNRNEADEVLQEIYTTVWNRAASFDVAKAGALTWLVTLSRNKSIDRLRQHREESSREATDFEGIVDEQASPADGAEVSQEHRRLQDCLDQLEPQQRKSVREAFFSGATYNELAGRLNVPLGTMKSWIRRSLMQLRTCLEP